VNTVSEFREQADPLRHVRTTAHRLFAERGFDAVTTDEIAAAADVPVRTVRDHFPTKETLFFAGLGPWVEGPAEAVRSRAAGVRAEDALRDYLIGLVEGYLRRAGTPQHLAWVRTLHASEALMSYEKQLAAEAEDRLAAALLEAWQPPQVERRAVPPRPRQLWALVASGWVAGIRSLLIEHRAAPPAPDDDDAIAAVVGSARRLLDHYLDTLPVLDDLAVVVPGRPRGLRSA